MRLVHALRRARRWAVRCARCFPDGADARRLAALAIGNPDAAARASGQRRARTRRARRAANSLWFSGGGTLAAATGARAVDPHVRQRAASPPRSPHFVGSRRRARRGRTARCDAARCRRARNRSSSRSMHALDVAALERAWAAPARDALAARLASGGDRALRRRRRRRRLARAPARALAAPRRPLRAPRSRGAARRRGR